MTGVGDLGQRKKSERETIYERYLERKESQTETKRQRNIVYVWEIGKRKLRVIKRMLGRKKRDRERAKIE
mgnify:CR=1 FL=1